MHPYIHTYTHTYMHKKSVRTKAMLSLSLSDQQQLFCLAAIVHSRAPPWQDQNGVRCSQNCGTPCTHSTCCCGSAWHRQQRNRSVHGALPRLLAQPLPKLRCGATSVPTSNPQLLNKVHAAGWSCCCSLSVQAHLHTCHLEFMNKILWMRDSILTYMRKTLLLLQLLLVPPLYKPTYWDSLRRACAATALTHLFHARSNAYHQRRRHFYTHVVVRALPVCVHLHAHQALALSSKGNKNRHSRECLRNLSNNPLLMVRMEAT